MRVSGVGAHAGPGRDPKRRRPTSGFAFTPSHLHLISAYAIPPLGSAALKRGAGRPPKSLLLLLLLLVVAWRFRSPPLLPRRIPRGVLLRTAAGLRDGSFPKC
ncbi:hypothetical protein NL676_028389 [Syzygium grande]|nr:hypothetical protein NL676_028389 [Syzygium grande]